MAKRKIEISIDGTVKRQCMPLDQFKKDLLGEVFQYLLKEKHQRAALLPLISKEWKKVYDDLEQHRFNLFASTKDAHKKIAYFCMLEWAEAGLLQRFSVFLMAGYRKQEGFVIKKGLSFDVTFQQSFQIAIPADQILKANIERNLNLKEGSTTKQELVRRTNLVICELLCKTERGLTVCFKDQKNVPLRELFVPYMGDENACLPFANIREALKIPGKRQEIFRLVSDVNRLVKLW